MTKIKLKSMHFLLIIMTSLISGSLYANNLPSDFNWSGYTQNKVDQLILKEKSDKRLKEYQSLRLAKKNLINGNFPMAKFHLSKVSDEDYALAVLKKRLIATVFFIEGHYEHSLDIINHPFFTPLQYYSKVCPLKMLNLLALKKNKAYRTEQIYCDAINEKYSKNNQIWNNTLGRLLSTNKKILDRAGVKQLRQLLGSVDYLEVWMKIALFLNQEQAIINSVSDLPESSYKSKSIRELIGFAYYRNNNLEQALNFISDIESSNADNIRGNIMLKDKKIELAYGHFLLALKKRPNSVNALERSIPISWKLKQWNNGLKFTKRLIKKGSEKAKKEILLAAFEIQRGNYKEAKKILSQQQIVDSERSPLKVKLMSSYTALRSYDIQSLMSYAHQACKLQDGSNCWLYSQLIRWENIGETIERDEFVYSKKLDIEKLKKQSSITKMNERILIDQKDIEELDSRDTSIRY